MINQEEQKQQSDNSANLTMVSSTSQADKIMSQIYLNPITSAILHPYFHQLQLSLEDLDSTGNAKFADEKKKIEFRGNWPYYQPIKCVRFGLSVSGKFDNGNDQWLGSSNGPGEWVIGFHGVRNPYKTYGNYNNAIKSILSGLHRDDKMMFVRGGGEGYKMYKCVNKPGSLVGDGIYFTPNVYETLYYTTNDIAEGTGYHLIFQCRLNPAGIRIAEKRQQYWVVPNSKDIRPYGIILMESSIKKTYPSQEQQFGKKFKYEDYKENIEKSIHQT